MMLRRVAAYCVSLKYGAISCSFLEPAKCAHAQQHNHSLQTFQDSRYEAPLELVV